MCTPAERRRELAEFLRSRRDRIPSPGGLRRVPGLRREEVAAAAGISVDYYIRLEQGRGGHPSSQVLDSLARALGLDGAERAYLDRLAPDDAAGPSSADGPADVPGNVLDLIELIRTPAFVIGPSLDVLAWNATAARVVCDFDGALNLAWLTFHDAVRVDQQAPDGPAVALQDAPLPTAVSAG